DTAGNILTLRRSPSVDAPSKVILSGPLFSGINGSTFNTTSRGQVGGAPCCSGFFVGQGAQLIGAATSALIQLSNSTFNAGPDAQSGGNFFSVFDTFTGAPSGELVAPARVNLAGPLLSATDGSITALFSLLGVGRSNVSSTGTGALLNLNGTAVTL